MGGDPIESWETRTAVGPTGLEGAADGGRPTVYRSGGTLGRPLWGGPGAQQECCSHLAFGHLLMGRKFQSVILTCPQI